MTGVSGPYDDLKHLCTMMHLFLPMQISPGPLNSILTACADLAWRLSSIKAHDDGTDAVIAYASRSMTKAKSHYPAP